MLFYVIVLPRVHIRHASGLQPHPQRACTTERTARLLLTQALESVVAFSS
jgi:hypothetical protein